MRKSRTKKKSALGKITQMAATRDTLFVLTDKGAIYEYVEDDKGFGEWEQLSDFAPNNVIVPEEDGDDDEEDEEEED